MSAHPRKKLVFVCSRNRRRSLTAEHLYSGSMVFEVRSAGTQPEARVKLTAGLIGWADVVFFMERSHLNRAREKFGAELYSKRVVVLNIPDEYEYMDPGLVLEIESRVDLEMAED